MSPRTIHFLSARARPRSDTFLSTSGPTRAESFREQRRKIPLGRSSSRGCEDSLGRTRSLPEGGIYVADSCQRKIRFGGCPLDALAAISRAIRDPVDKISRSMVAPGSVSLAAARERDTLLRAHQKGLATRGASGEPSECVMRGTVRIGAGRGRADSCVTRRAIGRWAWPLPPSRVAIGRARARRQMSLVTSECAGTAGRGKEDGARERIASRSFRGAR